MFVLSQNFNKIMLSLELEPQINNCRVREFQIPDCRAQKKIAEKSTFLRSMKQNKGMSVSPRSIPCC